MMSRRRLISAAIVAVVGISMLAGCVGIPSSSGVNVGGTISDNGSQQAPADLPLPPRKGESKEEILSDFMGAVTSPDNDYGIAKQFLTTAAAKKWNPTKSVLIRQSPPNPQPQPDGSIDYPVVTKASVDASGVYSQQSSSSTQLLQFGFKKVGGEWRISRLADGTVVSNTSFGQVFSEQALYFFDPSYQFLVPDVRWFPTGSTQPTAIVSALLGGPSSWLDGGEVVTAFPQKAEIVSPVLVKSSVATVDLSAAVTATKPIDRARMQQQLTESLQDVNVTSVDITVRGAPLSLSDTTTSNAVTALAVDGAALVGDGKKFGFAPRMQPIGRLSAQIVDLGATSATVDRDQSRAAVLAGGSAYLVTNAAPKPVVVDSRPGLIAPSIDPFGFVWSVPASAASAIQAVGSDGAVHAVTSAIPSQASAASLVVSHDGTRILLAFDTPSGSVLAVAGVLRHGTDNSPFGLGPLLVLPTSTSSPIDATWVDDRTVATLTKSGSSDQVTTYTVGGQVGETTPVDDSVTIVGGTTIDGLRVLTTGGQVQQLRSSGWQNTGVAASILGTQQ
jgi:hypothetical protein